MASKRTHGWNAASNRSAAARGGCYRCDIAATSISLVAAAVIVAGSPKQNRGVMTIRTAGFTSAMLLRATSTVTFAKDSASFRQTRAAANELQSHHW